MLVLVLFAFLAGVVTILSPCILPVLPIVLSGSVEKGNKRPIGIIIGFVLSFTFFTLFLSSLVKATGVSANVLRSASVVIIGFFGLTLLWPRVQVLIEKMFQRFTQLVPQGNANNQGMLGGVVVGLSLGLLWTPCVGPILAAVISLALTGSVNSSAFLITLAYALGTAIPMFAIMKGGRQLLNRSPWLLQNTAKIQQGFGALMVFTALAIFLNWDRQFQTWILTKFPQYGTGLTQFEENELVKNQLQGLGGNKEDMGQPIFEVRGDEEESLPVMFKAPELQPTGEWFNSEPLTMAGLEGKVVLVDFWTYSCINCIRTMPYLREWHEKYADEGLVIVGVHSPEFEFEKEADNVAKAIEDFELEYPIMQDNDFLTWQAYNNRYWPAKYLVDQQGRVRYTHFGEGAYDETENAIRQLLGEDELSVSDESDGFFLNRRQTPETYLGYARAKQYVNSGIQPGQTQELSYSGQIASDGVALNGSFFIGEEFIQAENDLAELSLNFQAAQVYLVMDSADDTPTLIGVELDGEPLDKKYWTDDMDQNGNILITGAKKYDILDLGEDYGRHILTLSFDEGAQAFAFTFGS